MGTDTFQENGSVGRGLFTHCCLLPFVPETLLETRIGDPVYVCYHSKSINKNKKRRRNA